LDRILDIYFSVLFSGVAAVQKKCCKVMERTGTGYLVTHTPTHTHTDYFLDYT
jgi:anaerobic ribonucleoside-triphosphate reductase